MEIIITDWALDSYLDLVSKKVFSRHEYLEVIRPDVMLLFDFPNDPKFQNGKFWSPAKDMSGAIISSGFKMKWHQIGSGRVQLRLTVGVLDEKCYLCEAYVKNNEKVEARKLAKFKGILELIRQGSYTVMGKL